MQLVPGVVGAAGAKRGHLGGVQTADVRLGVDAALLPDGTLLMVDGDTFISFTFNQTVSRTREPKHDAAPQLHLLFSTNVKPAASNWSR